MIPKCDECGDVAVKSFTIGREQKRKSNLCYLHATEANLFEMPLEQLQSISNGSEYPTNAVAFVLEALVRADSLDTVDDVCHAIIRSARTRFGNSAKQVLSNWMITTRRDLGTITFALASANMIHCADGIARADFDRDFTLGDVLDAGADD